MCSRFIACHIIELSPLKHRLIKSEDNNGIIAKRRGVAMDEWNFHFK
jgi:hypothetical protein